MDKYAQSLLELLLQIPGLQIQVIPGLKPNIGLHSSDPRAKMLMAVWEDVESKVADKKFKRPPTLSTNDITELEKAGYIKLHGDNLVMTPKGSDLIKIMLLNDDSNAFDRKTSSQKAKSAQKETIDMRHKIKRASVETPKLVGKNWYKKANLHE